MNRLQALTLLTEADGLDLPPFQYPDGHGGTVDLGMEYLVALAECSGLLPDCESLDDVLHGAGSGGVMLQDGRITAKQVQDTMAEVVDDVNRFGRKVDIESN